MTLKYFTQHKGYCTALLLVACSCVEEIDLVEELSFEDTLVIEANITDELKEQVIAMSRSYRFEDELSLIHISEPTRLESKSRIA